MVDQLVIGSALHTGYQKLIAAGCCLAVFICGCTSVSTPGANPALNPPPAVSQPGIQGLPAPADLPRLSSQAGQSSLLGSHFAPELPHNRVTVTGDSMLFDPAGGGRLEDTAYATYCFSILAPEEVYPSLDLGWTEAEQPSAGCWMALANWHSDSWDWHYVPNYNSVGSTSHLSLLDFTPYLKIDAGVGYLCTVVLVDSTPPARLRWLHLGEGWSGVSISAAATDPPRSLELASYPDDGSITNVDWDFESDGTIDVHSAFTTTHTYTESGIYKITAYMTDVDGTLRIKEKSVPVSPWSIDSQALDTYEGCADALLDDTGAVHLAFLREPDGDNEPPYDLLYATNSGGIWTEEPVCQVNRTSQPVLAEAVGQAHIILLDDPGTGENVIVHAWRNAGEWQYTELVDDEYYAYWNKDMVLDGSGTVHIAYCGRSSFDGSYRIRYASSADGFSFSSVPFSFEPWKGLALDVDSAGQPHIVCTVQLSWQQISCAYAHWDGTQWNSELVGESAYDCETYDLLIDDLQQPSLLYVSKEKMQGIGPYWFLHMSIKKPGGWQFADFSPFDGVAATGETGRLALDAGRQVMAAVGLPNGWDWGLDGANWFIYHDGSAWRCEVLEFQSYGGTLFGFGLDPLGRPWMCYDGTDLRLATRLE